MIRYILEATWRDKIGRNKKQSVVGVYVTVDDIEKPKKKYQTNRIVIRVLRLM